MLSRIITAICLATLAVVIDAHTVITYPGWRGDNLITNDTFPYGMQWMYPCGGTPTTTNRTLWPVTGGAISLQPGWFQGHPTAFIYLNMGFGTNGPDNGPPNMSFPMLPVFQIVGPSKNPYPGSICLPQVPLPPTWNATVKIGDNATIQVIETAIHGAALYSCVDITFADPKDVAEVNQTNCVNSSDISFNNVFSQANTEGLSSLATPSVVLSISTIIGASLFAMFFVL